MNSPEVSKALHKAVSAQSDHYEVYKAAPAGQTVTALRDLLDFSRSAFYPH